MLESAVAFTITRLASFNIKSMLEARIKIHRDQI